MSMPLLTDRYLRVRDLRRVQGCGGSGHQVALPQVPQEARHPHELPLWNAQVSEFTGAQFD